MCMIIFFTRHVRTLHTVIWLRMSCIMVSWYSCTCFVRGERRRNMTSAGWMTRRAGSGTVKEQLRRRQRTAGAAAAGCCDQGEDTSGATRDTRARRHKRSRRRHTCLTCCLISSLVALDDDISSGRRPGGPTGEFEGGRLTPALSSLSPLTGLYFGGNTRGKKFPSQTGLMVAKAAALRTNTPRSCRIAVFRIQTMVPPIVPPSVPVLADR